MILWNRASFLFPFPRKKLQMDWKVRLDQTTALLGQLQLWYKVGRDVLPEPALTRTTIQRNLPVIFAKGPIFLQSYHTISWAQYKIKIRLPTPLYLALMLDLLFMSVVLFSQAVDFMLPWRPWRLTVSICFCLPGQFRDQIEKLETSQKRRLSSTHCLSGEPRFKRKFQVQIKFCCHCFGVPFKKMLIFKTSAPTFTLLHKWGIIIIITLPWFVWVVLKF